MRNRKKQEYDLNKHYHSAAHEDKMSRQSNNASVTSFFNKQHLAATHVSPELLTNQYVIPIPKPNGENWE